MVMADDGDNDGGEMRGRDGVMRHGMPQGKEEGKPSEIGKLDGSWEKKKKKSLPRMK